MNEAQNDEIDLLQLINTLWNGKWIIVGFILTSFIGLTGYYATKNTFFSAETKINSISIFESQKYEASNALGFFPLSAELLMNTYIPVLNEKSLFEEAIRKYNLLEKKTYEDEIAYNNAVVKLADSIEIIPIIEDEKENKYSEWIINFEFYDKEKWMKTLEFIDVNATEKVRNILLNYFNLLISIEKQKRNFKLEDILINIENAKNNYDRKTSIKLAYLKEQAAIARTLGVATNTIETQNFNTQDGIIANLQIDKAFYLRGYIAIEKEIELIESRELKENFIKELIQLEQKQREITQNLQLKRAVELFTKIPISNKDEFKAISLGVITTKFEPVNNKMNIYALTLVISGMLGIFYVIVNSGFLSRKSQLSKES